MPIPIRFPEDYADKAWIDEIIKNKVITPYDKIQILSGTLSTDNKIITGNKEVECKEYAREKYRDIILHKQYNRHIKDQHEGFLQPFTSGTSIEETLKYLPFCSWFLEFNFELQKPYISHDDTPFYLIENHVRKDKVLKIPMVAASQWKGALLSVMAREVLKKASLSEESDDYVLNRAQLIELFGNEKENMFNFFNELRSDKKTKFERYMADEVGVKDLNKYAKAGRLRFYPSFFDSIGIEIINPHDRAKKIGTKPIYIESVPEGGKSTFKLLYVPFDLMGRPVIQLKNATAENLKLLANTLPKVFTVYGFGAKISSGFGVTKDNVINGRFIIMGIHGNHRKDVLPVGKPEIPPNVEEFWRNYPKDKDFSKKTSEWPGNKKKKQYYRKVKDEYKKYMQKKEVFAQAMAKHKEERNIPAQAEFRFDSIQEMKAVLGSLAIKLLEDENGEINA